jgi:TRAP-type C4-dicarboxylate transport system permease small subunit
MKQLQRALLGLWRGLHYIEDTALVLLLLMMILLAVTKIVLRNAADTSIVWADPFLTVAVLWVGLLGAMIAARDNAHIAIDIATRYLPERLARYSAALIALFAALVCAIVARHAGLFVLDEREVGAMAFAKVPAWICEIILPVAFALISVRYFVITWGLLAGIRPVRKEGV